MRGRHGRLGVRLGGLHQASKVWYSGMSRLFCREGTQNRRVASPCRFGISRYFDGAGGADAGLGGTTFVVNKRTLQPSLSCSKTMLQRPARDSAPLGPWPDRPYSPNAHAAFPARCA